MQEYSRRLDALRARAARIERRHIAVGNTRLATAVLAAVLAWLIFDRAALSPWWLLAPGAVFVFLIVFHERVLQARARLERSINFYRRALERIDGQWAGKGESGDRFLNKLHPYADDLDIFGAGSLFELLCAARTRSGERTLAEWLLAPASPEVIALRQAAIAELRPKLDLREDLAVLGEDVRIGVNPEQLAAWGAGAPLLDSKRDRIIAAVVPVLVLAGAAIWGWSGMGAPFFVAAALAAAFALAHRQRVLRVVRDVEHPAHDLALLSGVLSRLERESFTSPRLAELRAALETGHVPPSRRIARLNRLIELLDSRDNFFVKLFGPFVLYTTQIAFAIEHWRKLYGPAAGSWLAAVGEIEALSSLAGYAYEHPGDPFPEIETQLGAATVDGEALGHPLLPESRMVRNDVHLGPDLRLLVVSGSNMSGKSTLLRTVGVNAVLAMAGAPVRARRLRISTLAVGASIRIVDSLQSGSSRFYMEITRLRQLVEMTRGPVPVLFLLDELLHDTNSEDRRIGGEAVVRGLVERGAIGLITTHDLSLARMAEGMSPPGANVHFEDRLENGKLLFDYRLRPGITRRSNALELMRSVGLEV